ncbi:hypothetical protein HanIR_Chr07g0318571 [Helianthus annuus]|nr:hypothetical protein HanIR_Chr07g0318571 [Helianthus annuus]
MIFYKIWVVVFAEEIWVTSTEDAILKLSMDLAGVGISSHVKYKDVIHGFWVLASVS